MFAKFRFGSGADGQTSEPSDSVGITPDKRATRSKQGRCPTSEDDPLPTKKAKTQVKLTRKWQERYHSICDACFDQVQECPHYPDQPLKLLIVGHNPSDHAWQSGFSYSNPSNRLWKLLAGDFSNVTWDGVLPKDWAMTDQNRMPHELGIGFSDLGIEPGNDAAAYDKSTMRRWKHAFYDRMRQHLQRVAANLHADEAAVPCENPYNHGPLLVAFSGKRQYTFLFDSPPKHAIPNGLQDPKDLPPDWPLPPSCQVHVLPSSSGRAAMTVAQRCKPYKDLAACFHALSKTPPPPNVPCQVTPTTHRSDDA
ncbi:Aste57867_10668 [Aphanomyces stellatus]|uniref:Aste57867_10668 protein n=1 Tax=Aphanomyces stellatus TaxID=120398 RepID=A0A485KQY6_9STRA|nr:hypothetical protein As57867_010628 [Aphanomyces stellatus]VFT87540.1 Aste57867_10668 [Aphanomyces stellatus]